MRGKSKMGQGIILETKEPRVKPWLKILNLVVAFTFVLQTTGAGYLFAQSSGSGDASTEEATTESSGGGNDDIVFGDDYVYDSYSGDYYGYDGEYLGNEYDYDYGDDYYGDDYYGDDYYDDYYDDYDYDKDPWWIDSDVEPLVLTDDLLAETLPDSMGDQYYDDYGTYDDGGNFIDPYANDYGDYDLDPSVYSYDDPVYDDEFFASLSEPAEAAESPELLVFNPDLIEPAEDIRGARSVSLEQPAEIGLDDLDYEMANELYYGYGIDPTELGYTEQQANELVNSEYADALYASSDLGLAATPGWWLEGAPAIETTVPEPYIDPRPQSYVDIAREGGIEDLREEGATAEEITLFQESIDARLSAGAPTTMGDAFSIMDDVFDVVDTSMEARVAAETYDNVLYHLTDFYRADPFVIDEFKSAVSPEDSPEKIINAFDDIRNAVNAGALPPDIGGGVGDHIPVSAAAEPAETGFDDLDYELADFAYELGLPYEDVGFSGNEAAELHAEDAFYDELYGYDLGTTATPGWWLEGAPAIETTVPEPYIDPRAQSYIDIAREGAIEDLVEEGVTDEDIALFQESIDEQLSYGAPVTISQAMSIMDEAFDVVDTSIEERLAVSPAADSPWEAGGAWVNDDFSGIPGFEDVAPIEDIDDLAGLATDYYAYYGPYGYDDYLSDFEASGQYGPVISEAMWEGEGRPNINLATEGGTKDPYLNDYEGADLTHIEVEGKSFYYSPANLTPEKPNALYLDPALTEEAKSWIASNGTEVSRQPETGEARDYATFPAIPEPTPAPVAFDPTLIGPVADITADPLAGEWGELAELEAIAMNQAAEPADNTITEDYATGLDLASDPTGIYEDYPWGDVAPMDDLYAGLEPAAAESLVASATPDLNDPLAGEWGELAELEAIAAGAGLDTGIPGGDVEETADLYAGIDDYNPWEDFAPMLDVEPAAAESLVASATPDLNDPLAGEWGELAELEAIAMNQAAEPAVDFGEETFTDDHFLDGLWPVEDVTSPATPPAAPTGIYPQTELFDNDTPGIPEDDYERPLTPEQPATTTSSLPPLDLSDPKYADEMFPIDSPELKGALDEAFSNREAALALDYYGPEPEAVGARNFDPYGDDYADAYGPGFDAFGDPIVPDAAATVPAGLDPAVERLINIESGFHPDESFEPLTEEPAAAVVPPAAAAAASPFAGTETVEPYHSQDNDTMFNESTDTTSDFYEFAQEDIKTAYNDANDLFHDETVALVEEVNADPNKVSRAVDELVNPPDGRAVRYFDQGGRGPWQDAAREQIVPGKQYVNSPFLNNPGNPEEHSAVADELLRRANLPGADDTVDIVEPIAKGAAAAAVVPAAADDLYGGIEDSMHTGLSTDPWGMTPTEQPAEPAGVPKGVTDTAADAALPLPLRVEEVLDFPIGPIETPEPLLPDPNLPKPDFPELRELPEVKLPALNPQQRQEADQLKDGTKLELGPDWAGEILKDPRRSDTGNLERDVAAHELFEEAYDTYFADDIGTPEIIPAVVPEAAAAPAGGPGGNMLQGLPDPAAAAAAPVVPPAAAAAAAAPVVPPAAAAAAAAPALPQVDLSRLGDPVNLPPAPTFPIPKAVVAPTVPAGAAPTVPAAIVQPPTAAELERVFGPAPGANVNPAAIVPVPAQGAGVLPAVDPAALNVGAIGGLPAVGGRGAIGPVARGALLPGLADLTALPTIDQSKLKDISPKVIVRHQADIAAREFATGVHAQAVGNNEQLRRGGYGLPQGRNTEIGTTVQGMRGIGESKARFAGRLEDPYVASPTDVARTAAGIAKDAVPAGVDPSHVGVDTVKMFRALAGESDMNKLNAARGSLAARDRVSAQNLAGLLDMDPSEITAETIAAAARPSPEKLRDLMNSGDNAAAGLRTSQAVERTLGENDALGAARFRKDSQLANQLSGEMGLEAAKRMAVYDPAGAGRLEKNSEARLWRAQYSITEPQIPGPQATGDAMLDANRELRAAADEFVQDVIKRAPSFDAGRATIEKEMARGGLSSYARTAIGDAVVAEAKLAEKGFSPTKSLYPDSTGERAIKGFAKFDKAAYEIAKRYQLPADQPSRVTSEVGRAYREHGYLNDRLNPGPAQESASMTTSSSAGTSVMTPSFDFAGTGSTGTRGTLVPIGRDRPEVRVIYPDGLGGNPATQWRPTEGAGEWSNGLPENVEASIPNGRDGGVQFRFRDSSQRGVTTGQSASDPYNTMRSSSRLEVNMNTFRDGVAGNPVFEESKQDFITKYQGNFWDNRYETDPIAETLGIPRPSDWDYNQLREPYRMDPNMRNDLLHLQDRGRREGFIN